MHQRSSLCSREDSFIEIILFVYLITAEDHSSTRSAQCLVCCSGYHICVWNRTWMQPCGYQSCDVRHIYHKHRIHFICDLTEFLKVNGTCICRCTCNNHLWLAFQCNLSYFIIVNKSLIVDSIRYHMEIRTGKIHR